MTTSLRPNPRTLLIFALVVFTIGCDRVTKHMAVTLAGLPGQSFLSDTIRLQYAENQGGFLSLGADWPPAVRIAVFAIATFVGLTWMATWAFRGRWSVWPTAGAALCVAGGASNWIDRVVRGNVIDFMNVGLGPLRTGIFNVADVAVLVGGALLFIGVSRESAPAPPDESPSISL
jgi:signal peptidase II